MSRAGGGVDLASEITLRVGRLLGQNSEAGLRFRLLACLALEPVETVGGEPSVNIRLFNRDTVFLDRVGFASKYRAERLDRVGGRTAVHTREVGAHRD